MKSIFTKFFLIAIISVLSQGSTFAQTFCLQLTEVSNDGTNMIVSVGVQGNEAFGIGSSNLQFAAPDGAYGVPTIVSSPLEPPFYFIPTITQPVPGSYSLNIELAFADASGDITAAPGFTEVAQISLPILDAALADGGLTWEYNGGTTQTVMFLNDESTQLFATDAECLVGIDPVIAAAPNALCQDAISIGEGMVLGADIDGGEGAINGCFTGASNSLFYAYTASDNGVATVSSSIDPDTPDTRVSIYTGPCDDLTCLESDDDGGEGFSSVVEFDATAGTTYIIEWDDRWNDGEFDFEVSLVPDVVGAGCMDATACNYDEAATLEDESCEYAEGCDTCSGETDGSGTVIDNPEIGDACDDLDAGTINDVITDCAGTCVGEPFVVAPNALCADAISIGEGVVLAADISGGEGASNACFTGATNAIYYAYTASANGEATVSSSIDIDTPDTRVSILSSCDALECVASDDDGGEGFTSVATFAATAGTTYIIEWDDRWSDGEFDFEVSIVPDAAVEGCTDANACNYDDAATEDDGSCYSIGDACDDNDSTTEMDVIQGDCSCVGSPIASCELDSDNDGILDVDEGACPPHVATGSTLEFTNGATGTITNGIASADYSFVNDGTVGYKGVAYIGNADGIELYHQKDTVISMDHYAHTLNLTNITPGYMAVIRICPVAFNMDMPGSNAASTRTFSWVGGSGDANYADPATPDASIYRWPVPAGFDLNEREIIGLPTSGTISNGGGFSTYSTNNIDTEWYVDIPAGATSVSLTSESFAGGTGVNTGMDIKWPAGGWTSGSPGESTREWISFKVDLVPACTPLDSDGDLIPDYLDLDSDNDGCPDAIEGSGTFTYADVDANGALLCAEDACGVPSCAGPTGQGNNADVVNAGPDSDGDGISDACDTAPDNDELCNAESVTASACDNTPTITGDNTGASADGTAGSCWFGADDIQNNVWYSVEVPACGSLEIETHDDGGNDDTQLAAYTSDDNTCSGVLTEIGCDDDSGSSLMSLISLDGLTPGDIVFFQVDGYSGAQGSFGLSVSYGNTPDNDEPVGAIAISMDNYWGVPGWDTFDISCASETMAGCDGAPVANDTWYSFVAQAENTGILAQPNPSNPNAANMDLVIQVFNSAMDTLAGTTGADECEVDRSCFNNYGDGMIERAVPTGLVIGDTYFYRVYDANGSTSDCNENLIDTKVKTYVPHEILAGCALDVINTSHQWTIEDPMNMYNIPPVPVVEVRLVMKDLLGEIISVTPAQNPLLAGGLAFQLSDFVPIVPNGQYEICAQHKVKMQANGCIEAYWSQSGPSCPTTINLFGDVVTTLSDNDCGITGLDMNSKIKAKPIYGATQYRYNFENTSFPENSFSFDHPTNNLLLAAASVVEDGVLQGLYYGQTYNVTIQAFFNGAFNLEGPTCTITLSSTPPTPSINGCGTDILRADKIFGHGIHYQFGFYASGNAPPNAPDYMVTSTSRTLVFNESFINSLPLVNGETYEIYTRVYDQYNDPFLPTVAFFSEWSPNSCSFTMPTPGIQNGGDLTNGSELNLKFNVYPNPNAGDQVYLALEEVANINQDVLVEVFDMFGKKVHSEQIASASNELNKILTFDQRLSSGLYFINLSVDGITVTEKLVVE